MLVWVHRNHRNRRSILFGWFWSQKKAYRWLPWRTKIRFPDWFKYLRCPHFCGFIKVLKVPEAPELMVSVAQFKAVCEPHIYIEG
jgi:hypothetical protein